MDWDKVRVFRRLGRMLPEAEVIINFPDGVICLTWDEARILANTFRTIPAPQPQALATQIQAAVNEILDHHSS